MNYLKFIELFCKANLERLTKESINVSFKRINNTWYCDIPGWPEEYFANTMMVTDAHTLLCRLSPDANYITLKVKCHSTASENATNVLEKIATNGNNEVTGGAIYKMGDLDHIWLCPVTQFVLGGFPKFIEFEVATNAA
jgi:hypothetical protein